MSLSDPKYEILKDFQIESKNLIGELLDILEQCEGNFAQVKSLETYGQKVDRVMGGAHSLAVQINRPDGYIAKIGDYAAICKAVGYKASQIKDNEQFYEICVALLIDATEMLMELVETMFESLPKFKELFSMTFLDRLKWVSSKFGEEYRATVDSHKTEALKLNQQEIDKLLKKLGLD